VSDLVAEETETRYVGAARRLAAETGTASFTVQQVVLAAGGSLKGFYREYAGKDDLLCAMLAADCADGAAILGEMVARQTGTEARVHAWINGLFTLMTMGAPSYVGVLVREHRRLTETRPGVLDASVAPLIQLLVDELTAGGDPDPRVTAGWVFQLVLVAIHEVVLDRVRDPEDAVARLWRFCWGGIGGTLW
jgi:AcrR family transcriptional regulator